MKLVTVMLFSVLLVLGQVWVTPVSAGPTCAQNQEMPCCHHGQMTCCCGKATAPAKPVSTVPVRVSVAVPALVSLLSSLCPAPTAGAPTVSEFPAAPISAVQPPLYERDCARLI